MSTNENETINSTIDTETTDNEVVETSREESTESVEDLRKKIQTLEAQKNHWKGKATKPESKSETPDTARNENVSFEDSYALIKANVEADDIAEIKDYARLKGISIREALNSTIVKSIISEKNETRKTASATHTGTAKRTTSKSSDEDLKSNAEKGILPDSDEDLKRLIQSRFKR
jgi:hypothetical protein